MRASVLSLIVFLTTPGLHADLGPEMCRALHELVAEREPEGPGVAGAVMVGGEVACEAISGLGSVPGGSPVDRRTPFYIASLAKPMTAAAVLRLVAAGTIGLDDSVRSRIPELPEIYGEVTVRNLLRHESGVADHFDHLSEDQLDGLTNGEVLEFLSTRPVLEHEPGARWSYSSSGYVLLAEIVRRQAGLPYAEWMAEQMFSPAGMLDARVGREGSPAARAYVSDDGHWRSTPVGVATEGPGGIYASLADLEKWFAATRRGETIAPEFLVQAVAPTLTSAGSLTPFTLAFQVEDLRRGRYYAGAFGNLGGNRHAFVWSPDQDVAFILLAARPDVDPKPLLAILASGGE